MKTPLGRRTRIPTLAENFLSISIPPLFGAMIADAATSFSEAAPDKILQGLVLTINKNMIVDAIR